MYGQNLFLARVSVQHKYSYKIITEHGEIEATIVGKLGYSSTGAPNFPVVGDWVLVDRTDDQNGRAIIHRILTRKSVFERKAAGTGHERQIVAANIDRVFICMSLNQDFNVRRVERYLSIAWDSGAVPVIVLTKADLCADIPSRLADIQAVALGVEVIVVSSLSGDGYDPLLKYLQKGKTIALIGSSGVGKSTLINKLIGEDRLATKGIREDDDKGRHATTHRQLLVLPTGGVVIDTPGMREIQIAGADLTKTFADIEALAQNCYFRDCQHEAEPKCAVKQAVADGTLSLKRYESYKKLQQELAFIERKATMTPAQAEKQKVMDMMGTLDACKQVQKIKKNKR